MEDVFKRDEKVVDCDQAEARAENASSDQALTISAFTANPDETSWNEFPQDLIIIVSTYLSLYNFKNLEKTCKQFNALRLYDGRNYSEIQYHFDNLCVSGEKVLNSDPAVPVVGNHLISIHV